MRISTNNGIILIESETDIDASFLCLWESEVRRILEAEEVDPEILQNLLLVDSTQRMN